MTALAGLDYTAASGTLTIDAGQTTGTIAVEMLDDGVIEGDDETFTVELSGANGATIVDGEGLGTIEEATTWRSRRRGSRRWSIGNVRVDRGRWSCGVHGDVERDERRRRDGGVCDLGRDGEGRSWTTRL